jgi:uncharacterized alpha-E superfamily protein
MLSRIADSLFWLNRYLERSEGMLRLMRTNYVLSLDKGPSDMNNWKPLLQIYSGLLLEEQIQIQQSNQKVIGYLLMDPANENSFQMNLNKARENARGMQDHITKEVWEQVNYLYHTVNSKNTFEKLNSNNQLPTIEYLLKNCLLYTGIADSTMPRGMSWCFMNLGKYLERCLLTIELLDKYFANINYDFEDEKDILYWRSLLFSVSGYEFHLKNYRNSDTNINVAHQIIFNEQFPYSIFYCLTRIKKYVETIIDENKVKDKNLLVKEFGRIYSNVEFTDLDWIKKTGISVYLQTSRYNLLQFTNTLSQTFFSYS